MKKNNVAPKILWIDDDRLFLKHTVDMFHKHDLTIEPFTSVKNGIDEFKKNRDQYSLVLLDLELGQDTIDTDGIEVYKSIRQINQTIPISFVSAHFGEERWERKLDSLRSIDPFEFIIHKPIPMVTSKYFTDILDKITETQKKYLKEKKYKNEIELVKESIIIVNRSLLDILADNENLIFSLSPRQFEELVADLFEKERFEIEMTPSSRDGGKDLYAYKIDSQGKSIYAIECKQYKLPNKVGRPILQKLYGVIEQEKLTGGILATSSYFTKDAIKYVEPVKFRLFLQDYHDIFNLINRHKKTDNKNFNLTGTAMREF